MQRHVDFPLRRVLLVDETVEVAKSLITKDDFVMECIVNLQLFQDTVSKVYALSMGCRLRFLSRMNLVSTRVQIFC